MNESMDQADLIRGLVSRFDLSPHPEGGFFKEIYRSDLRLEHTGIPAGEDRGRCGATLIYFLLVAGSFSAFHRVRWTDEIWHLYSGGPLELHVIDEAAEYTRRLLTTDLIRGEPTSVVAAGHWQAARLAPGAPWAFCGCTVAPGFEFSEFEMPRGDELTRAHPAHASVIRELTR